MASGSWAPPRLDDFILTDKLGSGTYAAVYKAYRRRNVREVVAVKCVSKKTLNKASVENLLTEIEILKTVHHPHILELKDFQWNQDYIFLITEYCPAGDLSRFIRSRRILPEKITQIFLQQLDQSQFNQLHRLSLLLSNQDKYNDRYRSYKGADLLLDLDGQFAFQYWV